MGVREIRAVALDYVEGWFDGDAERMRRALHPDLVKRSLETDDAGVEQLETLTADQMIQWTAEGVGREEDPGDRKIEITVEHVDETIAIATCACALYVDYLQLARTSGAWKIVNILWETR
jgi:Putative lumazine-binding